MSATIIGMGQRNRAVYEAGFSGTVTVPDGTSALSAWCQAPGGAGRLLGGYNSGGGGGGWVYFETPILEAEWGTNITLSVGSAVPDANGEDTTLSGTLNGVAFSITAGGGLRLLAAGGSASGGTTNINGYDGTVAVPEDMIEGAAGNPGGYGQDFVEIGGTGGLGDSATGTDAEDGYIALEWG